MEKLLNKNMLVCLKQFDEARNRPLEFKPNIWWWVLIVE